MEDSQLMLRVLLANQFRVLELLDSENTADHAMRAEILEQGFEAEYPRIFGRFKENFLDAESCRLVGNVLVMHSSLLDLQGKTRADLSEFRQVGFDNNSEDQHLSYARFLFDRNPGGYPGVEGVAPNHRPSIGRWKRMVEAWKVSARPSSLTEADAARIIEAGHASEG